MPAKILLRNRLAFVEAGSAVTDSDYDLLVTGEADVYKPDGARLCCVRRGVVSKEHCDLARTAGRVAGKTPSQNRGVASGGVKSYIKADGTRTNTAKIVDAEGNRLYVNSATVGYFDRYPRIPYCRQTAFNLNHAAGFDTFRPMMADVADCFAKTVPERYAAQMEHVKRTSQDFVITDTPWTTITVNHNWPTLAHTDKGDLDEGFSCLTVLRSGTYRGGVLVFPAFRVGIDLQDGDLVLMDAHEFHANTPFTDMGEDYERIAFVFYYRTKMIDCGSAAEELGRAKNLRGSLVEESDE